LGGKFKEYHAMFNLDDVENGDLISVENEDGEVPIRADLAYMMVCYNWCDGISRFVKTQDKREGE
jgi:hypothetical protein